MDPYRSRLDTSGHPLKKTKAVPQPMPRNVKPVAKAPPKPAPAPPAPLPRVTMRAFSAAGRLVPPDRDIRIVALYKTFCGEEFVAASLASIYPYVDGIVMVHSATGWDGRRGNTVQPAAEAWTRDNDPAGKIRNLSASVSEQTTQYDYGLAMARQHFDPDFIFVVDTDEVWDGDTLAEAKRRLAADHHHVRFTCLMRTYVKTTLLRVEPPEFCHPTIFLRNVPDLRFCGPRGSHITPTCFWNDLYFHHFTYVREDDARVFAKIRTSTIGDGCRTHNLDVWRREKWERLPYAMDLHTTVGVERSWSRVLPLALEDLPKHVHQHPLVLRHLAARTTPATIPTSIIVPTYRSAAQIAPLLQEIHRRSAGIFEVIPTCQPGSASFNRNFGLDRVMYDAIIMVDDDITDLPYGWNQRLVATLAADPNRAMVSARLMRPDGQPGSLMGEASFTPGQVTEARERKLATACVAFRRNTLRFDEGFIGSGFEDDDICLQLIQQNPEAKFVVDNRCLVTHLNEKKNQGGPNWEHNKRHFETKWKTK